MANPSCTLPGCDKPARGKSAALCPMHYHRQYRHGSVHARATALKPQGVPRYRSLYLPNHPLAGKSGKVYEHRAVLFDAIGPGVHPCHWCGTGVDWHLPHGDPLALQVDHLNADGRDNRLDNLVPSCRVCNGTRARQAASEALRALGFWSVNDTVAALRDPAQRRRPLVTAGGTPARGA